MGGRGSSSGGGGGGGSGAAISESWTTPSGNKIDVEIDKKTTSFKDDWGETHTTTDAGKLEVKSLKVNGESHPEAEFGVLQHTDKIMYTQNGQRAAVIIPQPLQAKISKYYTDRSSKELAAAKKAREDELRMRRANGARGKTW